MLEIVENYVALKRQMASLIDLSGYENAFLAEQMGLTSSAFLAKKQNAGWTEEEMQKLLTIIENDALEDAFLLELMRAEKTATRHPIADLKAEFGW
ncbi:hypothetical protein [Persicitalea sp.]|uniref:hypothetical protein n=1 Tax=Persicitalea sp. TaxID=3100273 RepID=UPI00359425AC